MTKDSKKKLVYKKKNMFQKLKIKDKTGKLKQMI